MPAGLADRPERLGHHVPEVEPDILVPAGYDDVLVADAVDQRRVHPLEMDQDIGRLRERVAVPDETDVREEVTAPYPPVPYGVPHDLHGLLRYGGGGNLVEEVRVGQGEEERGVVEVLRGDVPLEIPRVGPDTVEERGGYRFAHRYIELHEVLGHDACRGTDTGPDIDEVGGAGGALAVLVVIDDDVDPGGLRELVVRAGRGRVDQGDVVALAKDLRGEPLHLDLEEVDERPVLLVPDVSLVEDAAVQLVVACVAGDHRERHGARYRVRVGVQMGDDAERPLPGGKQVVEAQGKPRRVEFPDVVDGGSGDHLLRVEDDVGALLLEEVDADRVGGARDDVCRRVAVLDGLEGGQVGVTIVGEDERDLRHGQPLHEVRVAEIADERFILLVPEILHPLLVLINDDEVLALLPEFLRDVIAGAPATEDDVLNTFL